MAIGVTCAQCKKQFAVPDNFAGRTGKCTNCGAVIQVPAASPAQAATTASDEQISAFATGERGMPKAPVAAAAVATGAPPRTIAIGAKVAGYKIERRLGDAKSTVVLAESPQGGKVALKVLPEEISKKSPTAGKRFLREARSLFGLEHPNVVSLLDAGEELGNLYLAMELFEGRPLRELMNERRQLAETEAIPIARQVASGLGHLKKHNLVHRNVKPDHILVDTRGRVKLVGLGLVRSAETADDQPVTMQGLLVGTPQYMSPESTSGNELDHRSDFFSLGITLYEMLTGSVPWNDRSQLRVLQMVQASPLPSLKEKAPGVSPATVLVVEKLLAKSPDQRYQTPEELTRDLEAIEKLELVDGKPPSFARPAAGAVAGASGAAGASDALVKKLLVAVIVLGVLVVGLAVALIAILSQRP